VKAYRKCVEVDPISCDTRPASARCLRRLHRYAEARSELVSHLRRRPGSPDGNYQFGLLLLETGDTSAAMKHLERAAAAWINADPEFEAADSVRLKLAELKSRGRL
jgi:tetratricopeptide (TPR) repeat protein